MDRIGRGIQARLGLAHPVRFDPGEIGRDAAIQWV